MRELQIFKSSDFGEIRTIEEGGNILFLGSDIAKALGYSNPTKAVNDHCKKFYIRRANDSLGRQQDMTFVSEFDLYRMVAGSNLPSAQKFEVWLFEEVIPSIRKHGAYMTPEMVQKALTDPDTIINLAMQLKQERERVNALNAQNSALSVKTAIMAPKADYFDALVDRESLLNFRETAKALGIGEREMIAVLLDRKYIYRDQKGHLLPYSENNHGYFEVKETTNEKTKWSGTQTLITVKGRELLLRMFRN